MRTNCMILAAVFTLSSVSVSLAQDVVPRPAKVVEISASATTISRAYPASVLPSRETELSFKVSGQVVDLPLRAAVRVAAGDLIAQIDTRDFENQINLLQSQRDQAEAQLSALRAGAREEELATLEAAVQSAEAQLEQAGDALARTERLLERNAATQAQFEEVQAQYRVAEANLRAQQEQLRMGQAGGRPEEIAAAEAVLRGVDAQIVVAQDSLADTTLTAPFDGIIARRDIDNFTNVQAGQSIVLLQELDTVHLAFDIPGPDISELTRNGLGEITAIAVFDALPGEAFSGELVEFSVQADSATQTYRGRFAVTVPEGSIILPGMIANVIAETPSGAAQVTAPLTAIASSPDGAPFVWRVDDDGQVGKQPVTLGEASGAGVVVTEGLSDGDTIVAAGVSEIVDGMTIRPIHQVRN